MSACHLPLSDMIRTYSHLSYLSLFRGCIILRYVCLFQIFSLNYQQTVLYLYQQMRRNYKIKSTEKLKANLWIYLNLTKVHHLKELTSPYIISYLHFLNLNNILTLPKLSPSLKLCLIWDDLCLPCFSPARFTRMHASLWNQNKCKPSIGYNVSNKSTLLDIVCGVPQGSI